MTLLPYEKLPVCLMKSILLPYQKKVEMNTFALSKIVLFALIIVNEKSTKIFHQIYNNTPKKEQIYIWPLRFAIITVKEKFAKNSG